MSLKIPRYILHRPYFQMKTIMLRAIDELGQNESMKATGVLRQAAFSH